MATNIALTVAMLTGLVYEFKAQTLPRSEVKASYGHYPYHYCALTNVIWQPEDGVYYHTANKEAHDPCNDVNNVWDIKSRENEINTSECHKHYDKGFAFTIFYYYGTTNNFHLHYDTMIPLYMKIYHNNTEEQPFKAAFMPSVESARLQKLSWDTKAFKDPNSHWVQIVKAVAGKHDVLPLDMNLRNANETICFGKLDFGALSYKNDDKDLLQGFGNFIRDQLRVPIGKPLAPRIAFISRKYRRRVLNENELADAVSEVAPLDLLEFTGMTFKQQVEVVQKYAVIVGINGAGLANAIYAPRHTCVVQLVPYKAQVNWVAFGVLLATRGPYIVWHNKHEHLHHPINGDKYNNSPDTKIHLEEFKELMKEALTAAGYPGYAPKTPHQTEL